MIKIECLSCFYGRYHAVKNISATFNDGEITAVIGPNGCGKSTLLSACCGQIVSTSGEILINNTLITEMSRTEIAQNVALLPQFRLVPDITVETLVLHGRFPWIGYPRIYSNEDREIAKQAMKRLGIHEKSNLLLSLLSGGERQRAYIAMLLTQNTQNIILDEPATYLDIVHQLELEKILVELKKEGKCIVTVMHNIGNAIEFADKIAVMTNGRLLALGSPQEIIKSNAIEQAFNVSIKKREQYDFFLNTY